MRGQAGELVSGSPSTPAGVVFGQHYPLDDDPGVAPPPNPPKAEAEVTPLAVAETDDAVIEPFVTFVP